MTERQKYFRNHERAMLRVQQARLEMRQAQDALVKASVEELDDYLKGTRDDG